MEVSWRKWVSFDHCAMLNQDTILRVCSVPPDCFSANNGTVHLSRHDVSLYKTWLCTHENMKKMWKFNNASPCLQQNGHEGELPFITSLILYKELHNLRHFFQKNERSL